MKTVQMTIDRNLAILCAALLLSLALHPRISWAQTAFETRVRVSNAQLDSTRGGFDVNSTLLSIGISRAVFINDELVITTTLNMPGLSADSHVNSPATLTRQLGAGAKTDVRAPGAPSSPVVILNGNGMSLIQNGPGNTAALQPNIPSAGSIIQNTLDNQSLRTLTTINAKVFSKSIMQGLNMTSSMRDVYRRPGR
jgi:hypothetical protein